MSDDGIVCPICGGRRRLRYDTHPGDAPSSMPCQTCTGTGRLYARYELDAAVKAEQERVIEAAVHVLSDLNPFYDLGIPGERFSDDLRSVLSRKEADHV